MTTAAPEPAHCDTAEPVHASSLTTKAGWAAFVADTATAPDLPDEQWRH